MTGTGIRLLSRLYGVQTSYWGADGRVHESPREAVLAVLRALGAERLGDLSEAISRRRRELAAEPLAPVCVLWQGMIPLVRVRGLKGRVACRVVLEDGRVTEWRGECDGHLWVRGMLPLGYHELSVGKHTTRLIVAPWRASVEEGSHEWGVFLPLYALPGDADFWGLRRLGEWAGGLGASVLGTLPLLASFLDEPFEPSPYAPVSRLAWNEFYVHVPGVVDNPGGYVDYRGIMSAKRKVLEGMIQEVPRDFLEAHPEIRPYAKFRGDARYHEFAQWLAHRQLIETASALREKGVRLYLDLPLGVHREGYDVRKYGEHFALEANVGAPPDGLFTGGQDWGFPPIHPERSRRDGHRYFIACLRHHLEVANMLRIDHVMGLHRLYWVPEGFSPKEGAYVRYPAKELYAILCLEARRHNAVIVGENLGTVPGYVNDTLPQHGIRMMYELPFHFGSSPSPAEVASLNTHDMPTFAGYWEGLDLDDQVDLGLLSSPDEARASREQALRALTRAVGASTADPRTVLEASLRFMGRSDASLVMVNLEDLWLERRPQNTPGTWKERANWVRRARYGLEKIQVMPEVVETLTAVDRERRRPRPDSSLRSE